MRGRQQKRDTDQKFKNPPPRYKRMTSGERPSFRHHGNSLKYPRKNRRMCTYCFPDVANKCIRQKNEKRDRIFWIKDES
jgi:hypothetical protein